MDDYMSRALWVNWLTGGSEMLPDSLGLKVPVDMVLALHTDAGVKTDSTTVGTLGLYSTDGGNPLGNGTSRYANRDLTSAVTSQVINDIRRLYDPAWTSRGNRDRRYYEVRETKVPAMIMELLSHQNFEDMKHALDRNSGFWSDAPSTKASSGSWPNVTTSHTPCSHSRWRHLPSTPTATGITP